MNELITKFTDMLGPVGSGALGHALLGLLILIVGLIIVRFIAGIFGKLLAKVDFLSSANLVQPVTSLIKALLTIFVLIAVLQHFGLTDVLDPLKNMMDDFLSALPKIIGAGVVGYPAIDWLSSCSASAQPECEAITATIAAIATPAAAEKATVIPTVPATAVLPGHDTIIDANQLH